MVESCHREDFALLPLRYLVLTGFFATVSLLQPAPVGAVNLILLTPDSQSVPLGGQAVFSLGIDFDDDTVGGSAVLSFDDALLSLASISFAATLADDPDFRCPTAGLPGSIECPADPNFVSFGEFFIGLSGELTVATLVFDTLGLGTTAVGASVGSLAFGDLLGGTLDVGGDSAEITVVPEPSSGLLILLGGFGLVALGRPRSRAHSRPRVDLAG